MIVALREWVAWHPRFGRNRQDSHFIMQPQACDTNLDASAARVSFAASPRGNWKTCKSAGQCNGQPISSPPKAASRGDIRVSFRQPAPQPPDTPDTRS